MFSLFFLSYLSSNENSMTNSNETLDSNQLYIDITIDGSDEKSATGTKITWDELTQAQKDSLKGDDGKVMTWDDLTQEQQLSITAVAAASAEQASFSRDQSAVSANNSFLSAQKSESWAREAELHVQSIDHINNQVDLETVLASQNLAQGQCIYIVDRDNAKFEVVLTSDVSVNGFDNIQCTGDPNLSLKLIEEGRISSKAIGLKSSMSNASPAINALIAYCHQPPIKSAEIEAGFYTCDDPLIPITKPISIRGAGRRQTILHASASMIGDFIRVDDVGFRNETTEFSNIGDVAYTQPSNILSGCVLADFNITGNRSSLQNGLVFTRNCDNVSVYDVDISYFSGSGLWLGARRGDQRGSVRESNFNKITLRCCGDNDGTASFLIERTASPGFESFDVVNMSVFNQIEVILPYGRGLEITAVKESPVVAPPLYGLQFTNMIFHGRSQIIGYNVGSLIQIEGYVANIHIQGDISYNWSEEYAVTVKAAADGGRPIDIDLDLSMPVHKYGVDLQNYQTIKVNLRSALAQKRLINYAENLTGQTEITVNSNAHLIQASSTVTLQGMTPIQIDFSDNVAVASEFFSQGDISISIDGWEGLAQYDPVTNMCWFTPTDPSAKGSFKTEKAWLSKIYIPNDRKQYVSGNWDVIERGRHRTGMVDLSDSILPRNQFIKLLNGENIAGNRCYMVAFSGVDTMIGVSDSNNNDVNLLQFRSGEINPIIRPLKDITFAHDWNQTDLGYLRLGPHYLWVDSQTNLRMKPSKPMSDMDGNVVGEQVEL